MSLRTLAPGFLACSAALLVGCGAPPVEDGHEDDVASAESAIKGGYEDTAVSAGTRTPPTRRSWVWSTSTRAACAPARC